VTAAVALAIGILLAGCAAQPRPTVTTDAASPVATAPASPSPTASEPVLIADGSAADNLPLFASVMRTVFATEEKYHGRAYIDALVAAGFDREAMEVTKDQTTVGNPADAIQFSVVWAEECLIGQVGPSTESPTAVVMPQVPGGGCLIGETRPIDW